MTPEQRAKNAEYCRRYRAKHREEYNAKMRARYQERKDTRRSARYGLTEARIAEMLEEQGGKCAICRTDEPGGRGTWHVDHNHDTGEVRGLLCHHCNVGIGNLGDDADRVQAAAEYLRRH